MGIKAEAKKREDNLPKGLIKTKHVKEVLSKGSLSDKEVEHLKDDNRLMWILVLTVGYVFIMSCVVLLSGSMAGRKYADRYIVHGNIENGALTYNRNGEVTLDLKEYNIPKENLEEGSILYIRLNDRNEVIEILTKEKLQAKQKSGGKRAAIAFIVMLLGMIPCGLSVYKYNQKYEIFQKFVRKHKEDRW